MLDNSSSQIARPIPAIAPSDFLPHVEPLIESLLATLVNFDFEFERERERICLGSSTQAVKGRLLHRLQERHRARREPYLQQISYLHGRTEPGSTQNAAQLRCVDHSTQE